ncbi:MAG: cytochrome c1 [Pseudomonadales bacterium]|jgi:cytochrome c1
MKNLLIALLLVLVPVSIFAAGGGKSCGTIDCYDFESALKDNASLQSGAMLFVNYCMACHEAAYSRYERVGTDLGIPMDLVSKHLIFDDSKVGSLMTNAMPEKGAKKWFGATPPDLTLVARARGADWLYTYLLTFYQDKNRPWGVNNLVFKDVGMPNVLLELQGHQNCIPALAVAANGGLKQDPLTGDFLEDEDPAHACGRVTHVEGTGSLTPEEFETAIFDLTNYMVYMAEPMALERERMGIYALLFIALLFVFTYMLNREYWKDVH